MITFLTLPRAFVGEFDALQRMALQSWRTVVPGAQLVLFGDGPGVREAARALDAVHDPWLECGPGGAPLVDAVFAQGERYAVHDWICFCSADVVLDFAPAQVLWALGGVARPFVVGQRWDVERGTDHRGARLHPPCGVDYFLYRRGTIGPVPPFCVRGGGADQWFVWKALTPTAKGGWQMTVIDATGTITAIHVAHSHPEWPNGKAGRQGSAEQAYNRRLYEADGMTRFYGIDAAPYTLVDGQVRERGR